MKQTNGASSGVQVTEIIGGIKLVTSEVEVKVPNFVPYDVKQPVFVAEQVTVPTGWDRVTNAIALELAEKVTAKVLELVQARLDLAIKDRIDTVRVPKVVEELKLVEKEVHVERPIFTDVRIDRPIFTDKTVINPVLKDVEVLNALIIDKPVTNAIIQDVHVKNAVIKDVEVERAIIRERVVS